MMAMMMNEPANEVREEYRQAQQAALKARQAHKQVVLATGVFDLFHSEHQAFLPAARAAGDVLLVGIESDARVRQLKGEGRPIYPEEKRLLLIQESGLADLVFVLPEDFSRPEHHKALIAAIRPTFLAVSEHSPHQDKKQAILEEFDGKVLVVRRHNPAVSTTKMVEAGSNLF